MKVALIIIGIILVPVILYLSAALVGFLEMSLEMRIEKLIALLYKKNEREQEDDIYTLRTRYSQRRRCVRYLFLACTVIPFTLLSVVICIKDGLAMAIMLAAFGCLISILPLSLCLQVWLSYEVITDDGIFVHRVFGKRFVRYTEMKYYKTEKGTYEFQQDVYIYGHDDKRVIWLYGNRIGTRAILNALDTNGIEKETDCAEAQT